MPPTLLLVHGLPATGKTTLAGWLAQQLGWPAIYKDEIKEILFDHIGWKDRAWSSQLGGATIEVLYYVMDMQLNAGVSCVAECNFKPERASPRLRAILTKHNARCVQVLCKADGLVRLKRFQARARHPGHSDGEITDDLADEWRLESLASLDVPGSLIEVDTTDLASVDYEVVLREIQGQIAARQMKAISRQLPST
jgi:predicted kinase